MNLDEIKDHLLKNCPTIRRLILYGSRAKGTNRERSDIDLADDFGREHSIDEWDELQSALETVPTLLHIDFIFMDAVSESFREKIITEGKILYEAEA